MIILQGLWGRPFDIKLYTAALRRAVYVLILQEREAYTETMTLWEILGAVVAAIVVLVIGFLLGIMYRKKVAEREISSAEEEAKRIINESIKAAESKKREALVEAREASRARAQSPAARASPAKTSSAPCAGESSST